MSREVLELHEDELGEILEQDYKENPGWEAICMEEIDESIWGHRFEGVIKRLSDDKYFKGTWTATDYDHSKPDLEGEEPFREVTPVTRLVEVTTYE